MSISKQTKGKIGFGILMGSLVFTVVAMWVMAANIILGQSERNLGPLTTVIVGVVLLAAGLVGVFQL